MFKIRSMTNGDADDVLSIYAEGLKTGHATFEQDAPDWERFDNGKLTAPRLIAECDTGDVLGWAVLSPVNARCVYGGVAEVTIFVSANARKQGVGKALLNALIKASEDEGLWTLQSSILAENTGSIRLHEQCGFTHLGVRKGLGKMSYGPMVGKWRDVVLMEKRSSVVGVD